MAVELEEEMVAAADELRFEYAAQLRDELRELRRDLREIEAGGVGPGDSAGDPDAGEDLTAGGETASERARARVS